MAIFPALLLACFAFWCGTFTGAAAFPSAAFGQGLLLAAALLGAFAWRDPLRLGTAGRWIPWALFAAAALSLALSPVARAGRVAMILLPAFLLLPAFVARCWTDERRRAIGLAAWSAVVAATAVASIVAQVRQGTSRTAMPLGHHNLLAIFLVTTLPVAALALRRRRSSDENDRPERRLAFAAALIAVVSGVAALALTRSFLAGSSLALLALLGAARFERARHLVLGLALLALAMLVPRAAAIVEGRDSSSSVRQVYLRAGWEGALARPFYGWGPGSTAWTLAEHLRPIPGVNPPGEVVGEMHSLPVELAYELGFPGLALATALAALFLLRRWQRREGAVDRGLLEAGAAGVAGYLLASLGGAQLAVTALPLAAMLAAGAALAGEGVTGELRPRARASFPVWIYVAVALGVLLPLTRAQALYERAARLRTRDQVAPLLARATELDPDFALYRARWAWSANAPIAERAESAVAAARLAPGVAALWLRAGALALEAGRTDLARIALTRALALDPLNGFAPFELAPIAGDGIDCAARALLAEPRLAAATSWRGHEADRVATMQRIESWPGIDPGWKEAVLRQAAAVAPSSALSPPAVGPGSGDGNGPSATSSREVELAAQLDTTPALAVSLHLFRRSAWPADAARIRVERAGVRLMKVPSAAAMPENSAAAFPLDRCAPR
ncbi:MAG: O-antigen ligase family protein [Thermoanaerobaculia bacterium]